MKRKVIAYLHTHWDREWYRTHSEFTLRLIEIVDKILEELQAGRAPSFYFDGQTDAIETYLKFCPEKKKSVENFIKKKKLFTGPFYASADSFLTSSWCLIKNFEKGIKSAKELSCNDFLGYLPDTFGHSAKICEILKYFNIKNAFLWRGTPDIEANFVFNGLKTTRLVRGYFFDAFHNGVNFKEIEDNIDKIAQFSPKGAILLPIGADHLQILPNAIKKIEDFNKKSKKYEIELSSPFEYIKQAEFKEKFEGEFLDNTSTYILQSVYSARTYQKAQNALCQWQLSRITEPLDILTGSKYKASLDFAYEMLIKNHAHDSLYGCSLDEVHRQVGQRFENVLQIADGIEKRIIRDIKVSKTDKTDNGGDKICVYNLSNFGYEGIAKIKTTKKIKNAELIGKTYGFEDEILYDNGKIPITEDYKPIYEYFIQTPEMRPFSKNVFEPLEIKESVKVSENFIENEFLKLEIKNGFLNIKNKKDGTVLKDFLKITDTKDLGDSYNFAPANKPFVLPLLKTKILKKSKLACVLGVFYKNICLEIMLAGKSEYVDFKAKINNKTKNHKLQASFKLPENIRKTIAEDTLGLIERLHDFSYNLLENLPVKRPKEAKTNFFPMQRFVWAQGAGIATLGLNEYEIYKNTLSITLLRAFGVISNPKNPARSIPAGPPIETPEAQVLGQNEACFAFCFKKEPAKMFKIAENFYGSNVAFVVDNNMKPCNKILLKLPKNKLLYGVKNKKTVLCYDLKENKLQDIEI